MRVLDGRRRTLRVPHVPGDRAGRLKALGRPVGHHDALTAIGWSRYSWYLRLPCLPSGAWTGIVRLEAALTPDLTEAVALVDASQKLLGRFASVEYKDARAPQNLVPIAGLERQLRHRLGDPALLYRELRAAAQVQ